MSDLFPSNNIKTLAIANEVPSIISPNQEEVLSSISQRNFNELSEMYSALKKARAENSLAFRLVKLKEGCCLSRPLSKLAICFFSLCKPQLSEEVLFLDSIKKSLKEELGEGVHISLAEHISSSDIQEETKLLAPRATAINISNYSSLTEINAPEANTINVQDCDSLTKITAPKVKTVDASGCSSLTKLYAPQATTIYATGCSSLTEINSPKAKEIDASYCSSLMKLSATMAKTVDCRGGSSLKTLNAPTAKTVDCRGSSSLKTLNAPEARKVNVAWCSSLTKLYAPQAKKVCASHYYEGFKEMQNLTHLSLKDLNTLDERLFELDNSLSIDLSYSNLSTEALGRIQARMKENSYQGPCFKTQARLMDFFD